MKIKTLPRTGGQGGAGWAHPYPVSPWSPVLYADGAGGDGGTGGDGGQGGGTGDGTGGQGGAGGTGDAGAVEDVASLPPWAQKMIKDGRTESATYRTKLRELENGGIEGPEPDVLAKVAAALGLAPAGGDGEPDPAALAQQLADEQAKGRQATVELAAYKLAAGAGARPDRLLNSRAFVDSLSTLDPAGATFEADLTAAIKATVDADPDLYKAAPAGGATRGGGDFNGAQGAERKPANLADAIAAHMGG